MKPRYWEDNQDYPETLTDLAVVLIRLGDFAAAMPMLETVRKQLAVVHRDRNQGPLAFMPMLPGAHETTGPSRQRCSNMPNLGRHGEVAR